MQSLETSTELKPIRITVPTVLGELRFSHTTSTSSGNDWVGVNYFGKSVRQLCRVLRQMRSPVATFKILDPVWINPTIYKRIVLRKALF